MEAMGQAVCISIAIIALLSVREAATSTQSNLEKLHSFLGKESLFHGSETLTTETNSYHAWLYGVFSHGNV